MNAVRVTLGISIARDTLRTPRRSGMRHVRSRNSCRAGGSPGGEKGWMRMDQQTFGGRARPWGEETGVPSPLRILDAETSEPGAGPPRPLDFCRSQFFGSSSWGFLAENQQTSRLVARIKISSIAADARPVC